MAQDLYPPIAAARRAFERAQRDLWEAGEALQPGDIVSYEHGGRTRSVEVIMSNGAGAVKVIGNSGTEYWIGLERLTAAHRL